MMQSTPPRCLAEILFFVLPKDLSADELEAVQAALHTIANEIEKGEHEGSCRFEIFGPEPVITSTEPRG